MNKKAMMKKIGSVYTSEFVMNRLCSEPYLSYPTITKKDLGGKN